MPPKLIYLHIPKTGGSSQRFTLYDLYQRDNVFWFDIDDAGAPVNAFRAGVFEDFAVIGGHRPLGFYPEGIDALFFSVLREPVDRVCSLFTHITRPELREGEKGQEHKYARWRQRGIDPDSLVNSLANCADFRQQASNEQCRYLSRHSPSCEDALASMGRIACCISTLDESSALNRRLGQLFQWIDIPEKRMNRSRPDNLARVLQEPGARAAIEALNQEDIRLYHHVLEQHDGLYTHIPDPGHFADTLSSRRFPPAISAEEASLRYLSVYSKGYAGVRSDGHGGTSLVIANPGRTDVSFENCPGLALRYEVLDGTGQILYRHLTPEPLEPGIAAGGQLVTHLKILIPPPLLEQAVSLRIEVMLDPARSVADLNPLHAASVHLIRV